MDSSDGTTTIHGTNGQAAGGFRLGEGVYVVSWSGSGAYLSFSLSDMNDNGATDISRGQMSGGKLFVVDGSSVQAGSFTLRATSDSDWTIKIEKPDVSSPASLPQTVSASEKDGAIIKPFKAHAGNFKISYSFSRTPSDSGSVNIYDVVSGGSFYTRPMEKGYVAGESNNEFPADGVYIAQVNIPPGASHGDITISQ